ncbi:MAG: DUF3134 domain-containing protein [Leptolyngbyaceae cyanobacterium]
MYNPSLRQIPRRQLADVLPPQKEPSILAWLENSGRLKPREVIEPVKSEADNEELSDLMGESDNDYDDDLELSGDDD